MTGPASDELPAVSADKSNPAQKRYTIVKHAPGSERLACFGKRRSMTSAAGRSQNRRISEKFLASATMRCKLPVIKHRRPNCALPRLWPLEKGGVPARFPRRGMTKRTQFGGGGGRIGLDAVCDTNPTRGRHKTHGTLPWVGAKGRNEPNPAREPIGCGRCLPNEPNLQVEQSPRNLSVGRRGRAKRTRSNSAAAIRYGRCLTKRTQFNAETVLCFRLAPCPGLVSAL